jgi:ribosomal protein S18 acetylase RimI-like enzyme
MAFETRLKDGRTLLVAHAQPADAAVGVTKVNLEVREDNASAIRLYEAVGFTREGVTARASRMAESCFANVMMGICLD